MKKKKKILRRIIITGIIVFFLISLVNLLSGHFLRPKLEEALTSFFEQPVKIKNLDMNFAFGRAVIRGIAINNLSGFPSPYLLKANKIIIEGNFLPFWGKKLIILKQLVVFEPEINIDYLSRDKVNLLALFSKEYLGKGPLASSDEKLIKATHKGVFVKKFLVKKAKIHFHDYEKGNPYLTTAEEVDIGVKNFTHWLWAKGIETLFIIKGQFKDEPKTYLEIQGQVSYPGKQKVNGLIQIAIDNIHLVHFAPYYTSIFQHFEVESGLANIYARIKSDDNNLTGASKIVIRDYTLKPKDKDGESIIRIGDSLKGETGELELMLRIGGTIEEPSYTLTTDISEAKMRELFNRLPGLNLTGSLLEGARKATSGIGRQIGDRFGNFFLGKKR